MQKIIIILAGILLLFIGNPRPTQAQVEKVEIRVDGLACPFCAYGLEKKLKDLKGVRNVKINVKDGQAALQNAAKQSIAVEKLESVVKNAGFTPREISLTVVGNVEQSNGKPVFSVTGSGVEFILKKDDELQKLQSTLGGSHKPVRITGRLVHATPAGHHAHPFTLIIEKFEVLP